jgi:O-antigen ligase
VREEQGKEELGRDLCPDSYLMKTSCEKFYTNRWTVPLTAKLKKACFYAVLAYLFVNSSFTFFVVKELLLYTILFLSFILWIKSKRLPQTPLDKPIVLFSLWSFISIFYSLNPQNALHDVRVYVLIPILFYYAINTVVDNKNKIQTVIYWIITGTVFWCIIGLIYFFLIQHHKPFIHPLEFKHIYHCLYPFLTVPVFILTLHLAYIVRQIRYKMLYILSSLILLFTTLLTLSRGGIIVLAISVILLTIKRWKLVLSALIILVCLVIASTKTQNLDTRFRKITKDPRFNIWLVSWYMIKDKPLTGWGFSGVSYAKIYQRYQKYQSSKFAIIKQVKHPHNLIIDIAVKLGLIGLAIFLYLIGKYLLLVKKVFLTFPNELNWSLFIATISILLCGLYDNFWNRHIEALFFSLVGLEAVWVSNSGQLINK